MSCKFIFVTGGVVSSLGKGISASSIGLLLKKRGFKVFMQKFDPYLNVDPGTMSPYQHGEVFVTDDGAEADLDIGHYERWLDENLTKESSITSGKIYSTVISRERKGGYLGATIQVIPHITNEIKKRLLDAAKASSADVVITEIGGTVGDIESLPFLEAIRQARLEFGYSNTMFIHNTLVPYLKTSEETKTKPTQHSVKELTGLGIQPDAIILRSEVKLDKHTKEKVSLFCNVPLEGVFEADDCSCIFDLPIDLHKQGIDDYVLKHFNLSAMEPDLSDFKQLIKKIKSLKNSVKIALVGKYVELKDAYLSVYQALKAAGYANDLNIDIDWIKSTEINESNVESLLCNCDGILVPGGFGKRGIEGKILAIKYARENKIPFLGICLGMQLAVIEYAQNVLGMKDSNSTEFEPKCEYPVIDILHNQYDGIDMGGTLRLGSFDCKLLDDSLAFSCYKKDLIRERHRHRYEFNLECKDYFSSSDMVFSGINPQTGLVEIVELKNHPFFIASQFHPEFTSRPLKPNPLFDKFIHASMLNKTKKEN
ncbi:MAG TPA: CTP synthase [Firmicutes bacterium]|nr:CTP synthase [Bacillota bacterium]